jgi:DNA replication and repair protein RecF
MSKSKLQNIIIKNFRNHKQLEMNLSGIKDEIICIIDKNGSGKTSILEAISLLSPGFGFRAQSFEDMVGKFNSDNNFLISIDIENNDLKNNVGIIYNEGKKKITINDKKIGKQDELKNISSMLWITPELQIDICSNKSARRKFFDKLVTNINDHHHQTLSEYEHLIKERAKVLEMNDNFEKNPWLDSLEKQIAVKSISVAKNRLIFLEEISKESENFDTLAGFSIDCDVCKMIAEEGTFADAFIMQKLLSTRKHDKYSMRTNFGVHRFDFVITYQKTGLEISECSSGEKKYLTMSTILSAAQSVINHKNYSPIILIDEFSSFIDNDFMDILIEKLVRLNCQIFLTGTHIPEIKEKTVIFKIKDLLVS